MHSSKRDTSLMILKHDDVMQTSGGRTRPQSTKRPSGSKIHTNMDAQANQSTHRQPATDHQYHKSVHRQRWKRCHPQTPQKTNVHVLLPSCTLFFGCNMLVSYQTPYMYVYSITPSGFAFNFLKTGSSGHKLIQHEQLKEESTNN